MHNFFFKTVQKYINYKHIQILKHRKSRFAKCLYLIIVMEPLNRTVRTAPS